MRCWLNAAATPRTAGSFSLSFEAATPGTIRGSFGRMNSVTKQFENVIHASSDPSDAAKEVSLWFKKEELVP